MECNNFTFQKAILRACRKRIYILQNNMNSLDIRYLNCDPEIKKSMEYSFQGEKKDF